MNDSTLIGMMYLWLNRLIMFEPKESYKHKIAKSLLAQWFQSQNLKILVKLLNNGEQVTEYTRSLYSIQIQDSKDSQNDE
jgi:hypothetical protein